MLSINDIFNESYYLETNSEAAEALANGDFASGLEHFQTVGIEEELRFSPFIDLDYYKRVANPDLNDLTNRQALEHLLETGIEEGRLFSPFIDLEFYQAENPELSDLSNSEALLHLRDTGLDQGLQFSPLVDLEEYRAFNPELSQGSLADAFTNLGTDFAPDDEGRIRLPLDVGRSSVLIETDIVTPELITASSEAIVTYSKSDNTVTIDLELEGLPYELDIDRPEDLSTPFNEVPVSVEDGVWQLLMVGNWSNFETTFWYDGQTGNLIGNEFELPSGVPDVTNPVDVNQDGVEDIPFVPPIAIQALVTDTFEANPDGTANVSFEFAYDRLLDNEGSAGFITTALPYNLNRPEEVGAYSTDGGLPISEALSWDDVLEAMRTNNRFALSLTLENDPKSNGLASRHGSILGPSVFYPAIVPEGVVLEVASDSYRFAEPADFATHINGIWPWRLAQIEAETQQTFGSLEGDDIDAAFSNDNFNGNLDTVFAGAGDDLVDASSATGTVFPTTPGQNRIFGGTGLDELVASRQDRLAGGVGEDILDASAGSGNNRLYGGEGDDELFAGSGDRAIGGAGDDFLDASVGSGNNRLYGGEDDDTFFLGTGDRAIGGAGDDAFIVTDGGNNYLTGADGADAFWIATGELITETNTITDFELDTDVIGVAGIGVTSTEQLELTQVDNNAVISVSGFDLAILADTQVSSLQSSANFIFA